MRRVERLHRYLDAQSRAVNLAAGVGLGIGVPLAASLAHPAAGLFAGAAVLGGSLWLGLTWQPVAIQQEVSLEHISEFERELEIKMVPIRGGKFLMGSPGDQRWLPQERPQHWVRVSRFAIMNTPVTQRLYEEVTSANPSHFKGDGQRPVEQVNWLDAVHFCNKLSERAGLTPAYLTKAPPGGVLGKALPNVEWVSDANGYRLPTEAEWEYAARAGSLGAYCFDESERELKNYAWYSVNSLDRTRAVGLGDANKWGLHDVHGNVWEWCWDWYDAYKEVDDAKPDPRGPPTGNSRVVRGGSFLDGPRFLRCAYRDWNDPGKRNKNIGFRCVRGDFRQL